MYEYFQSELTFSISLYGGRSQCSDNFYMLVFIEYSSVCFPNRDWDSVGLDSLCSVAVRNAVTVEVGPDDFEPTWRDVSLDVLEKTFNFNAIFLDLVIVHYSTHTKICNMKKRTAEAMSRTKARRILDIASVGCYVNLGFAEKIPCLRIHSAI